MNGGAIVALLTFLGHDKAVASRGAMAGMDASPSNDRAERRYRTLGNVAIGLAILASIASLLGFIAGAWCAIGGLGG